MLKTVLLCYICKLNIFFYFDDGFRDIETSVFRVVWVKFIDFTSLIYLFQKLFQLPLGHLLHYILYLYLHVLNYRFQSLTNRNINNYSWICYFQGNATLHLYPHFKNLQDLKGQGWTNWYVTKSCAVNFNAFTIYIF